MTPLAASLVVALALFGGAIALVGSFGMLRLRSFYERAHPATLAATLGATSVLLASLLFFSLSAGRFHPKALLVIVFIPLVNPVTTMLLARAALSRDRARWLSGELTQGGPEPAWRREAEELRRLLVEAAQRQEDEVGADLGAGGMTAQDTGSGPPARGAGGGSLEEPDAGEGRERPPGDGT